MAAFVECVDGVYSCEVHGLFWCSQRRRIVFAERPKELER
jgi:hypothetical protein